MNLYLLTQNNNNGWDTYDSCVVVANSEEEARLIHPNGDIWNGHKYPSRSRSWANTPDSVMVELIGNAINLKENTVVISSFNAG
jgi:hypothetical protein